MIFGRLRRARLLTAGFLAVALSAGAISASLSSARALADREIRGALATAHLDAMPSARVSGVWSSPSSRAAGPVTHPPVVAAVGAIGVSTRLVAAAFGRAFDSAHPRPRRLAFRYDATAPPSAL